MRRYFVCKVETVADPEFGTVRRPVLDAHRWPDGTSVAYEMSDALNWALVVVTNPIGFVPPAGFDADSMPDFPLDAKLTAMQTNTRNQMIGRLAARGIDTSFVGSSDGFRDVIRSLGLLHNQNFREDSFGVRG